MLGFTLFTVTSWVSMLLNASLESFTRTNTCEGVFGPSANLHWNEPVVLALVSEPATFEPPVPHCVLTGVMASPSGSLIV